MALIGISNIIIIIWPTQVQKEKCFLWKLTGLHKQSDLHHILHIWDEIVWPWTAVINFQCVYINITLLFFSFKEVSNITWTDKQ